VIVPETTVYEDDGSAFREYQIGRARQTAIIDSITKAKAMECPAK
jgi:hypothetical protein